MAASLVLAGTFRLNKLSDELFAAIPAWRTLGADGRLIALATLTYDGTTLVIDRPDTTQDATAQSIAAAHNAATPSAAEVQTTADGDALSAFVAAYPAMLARLATIQSEMDTIKAHADTLAGLATWSGLTLAQTTARLQATMPVLGQDLSTVASEFKAVASGLVNMLQALAVLRRRQGG